MGKNNPLISLWSKYNSPCFICFTKMLSPVISNLDDIYCTFDKHEKRTRNSAIELVLLASSFSPAIELISFTLRRWAFKHLVDDGPDSIPTPPPPSPPPPPPPVDCRRSPKAAWNSRADVEMPSRRRLWARVAVVEEVEELVDICWRPFWSEERTKDSGNARKKLIT